MENVLKSIFKQYKVGIGLINTLQKWLSYIKYVVNQRFKIHDKYHTAAIKEQNYHAHSFFKW
jgi:hypothetical protein